MESFKHITSHLLLTGFLTLNIATAVAGDQNLDLEPAVSGAVSASGLYPTQAAEDAAHKNKQATDTDVESRFGNGEDDVISAFGGHRDDFLR